MAKEIIDSVEKLEEELARVREAQRKFSTYTQEQVDKIFLAAAKAANMARIPLAKMAVEETGMGVVEDKIIKNHYAAEYIYNKYKNTKTCGVIDEDKAYGTKRIAEPLGVVCAVIPTTHQLLFLKPLFLLKRETVSLFRRTQELRSQQQLPLRLFLTQQQQQVLRKISFLGLTLLHLI